MKSKKLVGISFVFATLIMSMFFMSFVSADVNDVLDDVAEAIRPSVGVFLNIGQNPDAEDVFVRLLIFILIFAIVMVVLRRMGDESKVTFLKSKFFTFLIAVIVSALAMRIFTEQLTEFILLPQGVLGVVLASLLPFVIYYYFLESFDKPLIRKVGWTLYLLVFAGLAFTRWDDLYVGGVGGNWWANLGWIYLGVAVLSLLMVLNDAAIRRWKARGGRAERINRLRMIAIGDLEHEHAELVKKAGLSGTGPETKKALNREADLIQKQIDDLQRKIS